MFAICLHLTPILSDFKQFLATKINTLKFDKNLDNLCATIRFDTHHGTLYKYPKELNLCSGCACWLYKDVIEPEMKVYEV